MDNSKKSVHNSGPLGMLVKTGQIKKIDADNNQNGNNLQHVGIGGLKSASAYFKTEAGIKFNENELVLIDPKECEPWEYANRSENEMGDMEELIKSIKENTQLQPALIRTHPQPHDGISYQIIFGRRRHAACLALGVKLLVIKKDNLSLQDAIICQDAENKFRKNVSHYSNAILYKKLLSTNVFKTEKELAEKLGISPSSLNELMTYAKLPSEVVNKIPNVHSLSIYMAAKIVRTLSTNQSLLKKVIEISSEIGQSINTPAKFEHALKDQSSVTINRPRRTTTIHSKDNKKIFIFKIDHKGIPSITFQKDLVDVLNFDKVCENVKEFIESLSEFGRPNFTDQAKG